MEIVLLAGRFFLAGIFVVAAVAKLTDRRGFRQALSDFEIPQPLVPALGVALPLSELVVAVALIPRPTAWWGALAAFFLLVMFIAAIVNQLAHGRRPDCHCFGQLHSTPVGRSTVIRNALLAAVSGLVIAHGRADPGPSAVAWLATLSAAEGVSLSIIIVAVVGVIAQGWLLLHLLRQNGRLLLRIEAIEARLAGGDDPILPRVHPQAGLAIGTRAPSFELPNLQRDLVSLDTLRSMGKPIVLTFTDPACGPCNALLPDLARYQREHRDQLTLAIISSGGEDLARTKTVEHGLAHLLLQQDREVAQAYASNGTPCAVMIRPDGTIGSQLAQGSEQIKSLVATITASDALSRLSNPTPISPTRTRAHGNRPVALHRSLVRLKVGDLAPGFTLPDLEGRTIDLANWYGERVLVLFWNPGCGFCQRILPDLKTWEAQPPVDAPKLLVVSTGTPETNATQGLRSPVVLDEGFRTGRRFGVGGTPSAVLLDEQGKIDAPPAIGSPQVLALLGGSKDASRL